MAPQLHYAILELGLRCNLRCIHCASASGRPREHELDLDAWKEVVSDLASLGCRSIDLMGGEVLLSPLLEPVGRALVDAGLSWGMLTNGWLLDERRASELFELGCRGIGVSLDAASPEVHDEIRGRPGSHQRALRALASLCGLPFSRRNRTVLTSVCTRNLGELEAMSELLARRFPGYRWQINLTSAEAPRLPQELRLSPAGLAEVARFVDGARRRYSEEELLVTAAHDLGYFVPDLDLHDFEWSGCPAGIHHLGVQSDGKVKGCLALDERFAVGNVRERRLVELWQDPTAMALHRGFTVEQLGPSCRTCVWGSRCRGGCSAYGTANGGGLHDHPHCLWREAAPERRELAVAEPGAGQGGAPYLLLDDGDEERAEGEPLAEEPGEEWTLPLRSVCLELTLRCNLRCLHCGSAAGAGREGELDLTAFVGLFGDLRRLGCHRVVLLGGEPLLHPDWEEIAAVAVGFGLEVALITNGLPVSERVAARLLELGLTHVGVSIDGATDGTHDRLRGVPRARLRAWTAVDRLRAAGLPVTVITTLCRANLHELTALRDQLADRGGLVWQIQAANGTGERFLAELMPRPADLLEAARFIEATRRELPVDRLAVAAGHNIGHHACTVSDYSARGSWRGCPGGITAAGISSDGGVKGCLSMRPSETVGSIRTRALLSIWRDPSSFERARSFRPGRLRGGCAVCPHGASCRAGCPEMARTATGEVWDNPFCLRQVETVDE